MCCILFWGCTGESHIRPNSGMLSSFLTNAAIFSCHYCDQHMIVPLHGKVGKSPNNLTFHVVCIFACNCWAKVFIYLYLYFFYSILESLYLYLIHFLENAFFCICIYFIQNTNTNQITLHYFTFFL